MYHFGGSNSHQIINSNNIHYGNDNRTPSSGTHQELQSPYMYSNHQIHQRNIPETQKENLQNPALESHQFMATTSATNRGNGNSSTALLRQWRRRSTTNQMKQQLSPTQQIQQSSPPLQHHNTNQIIQQSTVASHQINNNVQQQSQQYPVSTPSHITGHTGPTPQQMRQHYPTTNDILETHHHSHATKYYPSLPTNTTSPTTPTQPNLDQIMDVNYYNRNEPSAYYGAKNQNQPKPKYPQNYPTYSPQMGYNKPTAVMNPPPPPSVQTITQQISYQNHVAKGSLYRNYDQTNAELMRNRSFGNETTSSFPYDPYSRGQQKLVSNDYYHQMGYKLPPPNNVYKKSSYIPSPYHPAPSEDYYKYQVNPEHTDMSANNYNNPSLGTAYDPNWLQCCSEMKSTPRYPCYPEPMIRKCNMNTYTPSGPPTASYQQRLRYDEYNNFNYNSNVVKPQPVTPNKYPTWDQNKNYCTTIADKYPFHGYGTNSLPSSGTNYYNTENYLQPEKQVRYHQNILDPYNNYSNKQHFMYPNWRMNTQATNGSEIIDFENHIKVNRTQKYEYANKSKLNLKEFLETWDEDEEAEENQNNHTIINLPDVVLSNKASKEDENMLYILESTNIPEETVWSDYKHIQQIDKLPDNIKLVEEIKTPNELTSDKLQHEFDAIIPDSTRCDTVIKSPDTTADCIQTTIEDTLSILENDGDIVSSTCSVIKSPTGIASSEKPEKSVIEIKILDNSIVENVTTTYNNKATIIDFETKDITVKCNGHCSFINKCEQCQTDDIINELISPRISEICTQSNLSHYSSSKCGDEDEDDIEEDQDENSFNSISENEILDLRRADDEKRFNFENLITKLHTDNSPKSLTAICTEKYISEQFNVTTIAIKHDDTVELKMVDNEVSELNENGVLDLSERRNSQLSESIITDVKEFPHIKRHLSADDRIFDEHEVKSPKSSKIETQTTNASTQNDSKTDNHLKSQIVELNDQIKFVPLDSSTESSESKIQNSSSELNPKLVQNDWGRIKMKSESEQSVISETNTNILKNDAQSENIQKNNSECFSKFSTNDNSNNLENECLKQKESEILESTKNLISNHADDQIIKSSKNFVEDVNMEIFVQNLNQNTSETNNTHQNIDGNQSIDENKVEKDLNDKVSETINYCEDNSLSVNSETSSNCLSDNDNNYINNDKVTEDNVISRDVDSISVQQSDNFPSTSSPKFEENRHDNKRNLSPLNPQIVSNVCKKQELNPINDGLSKSSSEIESEDNINEMDVNDNTVPKRSSLEEQQVEKINNAQDSESSPRDENKGGDIEDPPSVSEYEDSEDSKSIDTISENTSNETSSDIDSYVQSPIHVENSVVAKIKTPMNIERNEKTVIKTPLSSPESISETVKSQSESMASVISNCDENSETAISNTIEESDIGNTKHQNFFVNETNSEPGEEIENEKQQVINEENVFEKQQVDDISISRQRVDEIANEKQNLDDTTDGNIFTEKQSGDEIDIKKRHFRENTTETQPQSENDIEKQPINNITTEVQDDDKIGIEKQYIGDISTETQSGDEVNIEKEHLDEIITETLSECEIDIKTQSIKDITPETQTVGKIIIEKRCFDDTEEMQSDGKIDIAKQCIDDNTVETESDNEIDIERQFVDDITVEIQSDNEINIENQHTDDNTVETQSSDNIDIEKQRGDDISIETESDNEIDIQTQFVEDITVEFQSNNEIDIEKQHADDITVETQSSDNIDIEKQRDDDITVEIQSNNEIDIKKQCVNGIAVEPQSDNEVHIEKRNIDDIATEKQFDKKIDIENEHIDDIAIGTQPDNEKDKNFDDMADMTLENDIDNQVQHAENMAVRTQHKNDGKEFVDDYTILARNDIDIEEQHVDCISEKIQHAKEVIEKEHSDNIFAEKQQSENEIETQNISVETKHFNKMDWDEHVDNIVVHQDDENATGKEHVDDNIINQELQEHNEEEKSCVHKVAQSSEHTDEISNENPQIGSITVETQPENDTNLEKQCENIADESEHNDHIFVKTQQDDGLEKRHVNNIFDEKPTADDINSEKQFVDNIFCESQDNNVDNEEIVETELDMDTRHDNDIDEQKQNVDEISVSEEIYIEKQHITLHGDEIITKEPHVESDGILIANENSEITTENISNQSSKTIDSTDYIEEHSEIVNSVNIDGSVPMDPWIQLTEDIIAQTKTSIFNTFHIDHKTSENYSANEQINEKNFNIESLSSLCRRKLDEKQAVKDNSKPSSPLPADNCSEIYDQVCYEEVIDENMQSDDENENILIENSEENYQDAEADTEVIDDISDENIVLIIESNDDESDETGFLDDSSTIIIAFDDELLESNNIENDETGQVSFQINSENESNSNEINTDSIIEKEIQLEIENILTKATDENETELEENEPQIQNEVSQNEELNESISNSPRVDEDFENENPNLWLYTEEEVVSKFDEEIKNDEPTDSSISNEESESSEIIPSSKLNETDKKDYSIEKFDESFKSNKKIESSEISSSSNYIEEEESCKKSDEEIEVEKSDEKEKPEEIIANENDIKNEEEVQPAEEIRSNKKRRKSGEEENKSSEIKFDKENIVISKEVKKSDEEIDHNKKRRKSDDEKRKHSGIDTVSNDKYTEVIKSTEQIDSNIKRRRSNDGEQKSIQKSADKESKIKCTEEIKSAENKKRRKSDDGKMKSSELEINKESNVKCTLTMKSTEDIGSESKKRRKSNEEESSEKMFVEKSGNIQRTSSDQGSSSNETDKSLKTKENIGDLKNKYNKNYKKNKFKYENFRGSCSEYERKRSKHEGKTSKYLPHSYKSSYHSKDSSKVIEKNNNSENFNANEMRDDAKTASSNVCNILNNYDKYFEQQRMVANYKIPKLSSSTSSKQEYPKNSLVVSNNNKTKSSDNKNSHGIKIKIKNITDQVYKSGYRNKGAGSSINQYKIINKHSINQSLISSNKLINDNNKVVPKVIIKRETSTNCKQNITNQTDKHHMFTTNLILNNAFKWQPFVRIVRDTKIDRMALKLYKQQKIILKINRVNNNNYHYCSSESSQTSSPSASASYKSASFKCRIKLDKNMLPAIVQSTEFNKD